MLSLPGSARDAVLGAKLVHRDTEGPAGRYLEKLHGFGIRRAVKSPDMGQWPGAETHERSSVKLSGLNRPSNIPTRQLTSPLG